MSLKKLGVLSIFGLLIGYLGTGFYQSLNYRGPSSELSGRSKIWSTEKFGKTSQAMSVVISTVGGVPERDEQELRLKAEITLNQIITGDVNFEWMLPEGVSVVSGDQKDILSNLHVGQTASVEISVLGVSKEGFAKTVTLQVSGDHNGVHYGGIGSFATNSQSQMTAAYAKERDSAIGVQSQAAPNLPKPKIRE